MKLNYVLFCRDINYPGSSGNKTNTKYTCRATVGIEKVIYEKARKKLHRLTVICGRGDFSFLL